MSGRDELSARRARATAAWQGYLDTAATPTGVSVEVAASWARSASQVHPGQVAAPVDDDTRTADEWRSSALYHPVQSLLPDLAAIADDEYVVAITDPWGKILFSLGGRRMRREAERVNFVAGGRWDEASVGTNALDLALRTARPQQVFSAEHYTQIVHDWVCYSAPVLDPATGRPLGVLDLSSTWEHAHPFALATASALARNLQAQVDGHAGTTHLRLRTLSTAGDEAVGLDGVPVHVSPRHLELLTVLSLRPQGSTLEELHAALYPDHGATPASCKAEVSHLRRLFGDTIGSRPYRLQGRVVADHLEVERLLEAGLVAAALALYEGPLLPRSLSPAIVEHRGYLQVALRTAVLATGDPQLLIELGRIDPDDAELHEHALALLPATDLRRAMVEGRLARS